MFDLPSPSELFERARNWFSSTPDPNADPVGPTSSATQPDDQAVQSPADQPYPQDLPIHSAELVERPRSLSALLRQGSSMTEASAHQTEQPVAEALSPREWDQLVDLVVERIEERVRDELSRRGRRFSPGVF